MSPNMSRGTGCLLQAKNARLQERDYSQVKNRESTKTPGVLDTRTPEMAEACRLLRPDPHPIERTPDENDRKSKENGRQEVAHERTLVGRQLDGELDGQEPEERRELDDRVQGHRRGVLEGIADGIAHDRRGVKRSAFGVHLDLDDLLRVVPRSTRIGHENGLVEAEERDRDEVADEEIWLEEREGQRREEDRQEDVQHPLLRILRADFDDLLAVRHRGLFAALQLDVRLDELDRSIRPRRHRLRRRAGEPVDDGAAGDQAQEERRIEQ